MVQRERQTLSVTRTALTGAPERFGRVLPSPKVVASPKGRQRLLLTPERLDQISRLPAKIASQVKKLSETGWFDFAKTEMAHGRNPASKGWKKVFCDALLAGGHTVESLRLRLMNTLDMSKGSAQVQVSTGMAIFAFGRLATVQHGRFTLSQN